MDWFARAIETLAPLSVEKHNGTKMFAEWHYSGNAYDLGKPIENCQLCGHPDIRYQFEIINRETKKELLVGSECINKFGIAAIDEAGVRLDDKESKKKVNKDRSRLITEAKKKRLINVLVKLGQVDTEFKIQSFIDYFDERGAFTPKQLALLIWRLEKHSIEFTPSDFKLVIKRDGEQADLLNMADWKVKKIWKCMSAAQQRWYDRNTGRGR